MRRPAAAAAAAAVAGLTTGGTVWRASAGQRRQQLVSAGDFKLPDYSVNTWRARARARASRAAAPHGSSPAIGHDGERVVALGGGTARCKSRGGPRTGPDRTGPDGR